MVLDKIVSVVYEPFVITTVLGLIITIWQGKKMFLCNWLLLFFCIFMLAWRSCYGTTSSRYWAIFIFPALYYTIILCQSIRQTKIFLIIAVVIIAFAIGKNLHFNPHSRFILNAAETISNDAQNYSKPLIVDCDTIIANRLAYYTRIPMVSDKFSDQYLQSQLHALRGLYDVIYLVYNVSKHRHNFRNEKLLHELGAELIFEEFHDRYKKKKTYVYRLPIAPASPIEIPIELYSNGGFENLAAKPTLDPAEPALWGCTEGAGNRVKITTISPAISGERSLLLQRVTPVTLFPHGRTALSYNRNFLFTIKNGNGSDLSVRLDIYGKKIRSIPLLHVAINTDEIHQFQIPLRMQDFKSDDTFRVYWSITSPDGILIDDVGFGPEL